MLCQRNLQPGPKGLPGLEGYPSALEGKHFQTPISVKKHTLAVLKAPFNLKPTTLTDWSRLRSRIAGFLFLKSAVLKKVGKPFNPLFFVII
jgi:hypothetical protein